MEQFDIAADDAPTKPFVQGHNLRMKLETLSAVERQALRQPGAMKHVGQAMRARLTFADARVPDLRAYNRYLPNEHLRFDGGAGTLSGDLTLDGAGAIGQGTLGVDARAARMHLAGIALRTDVDIDTKLHRADLKRHTFNIDGTRMALQNVSFTEPGGESRTGWWTRIDLQRARMDWDRPVSIEWMTMAEAQAAGADAFFDEKYGERVRTIRVDGYSHELCGGTHCRASGQIGSFVITGERSIGSGMRRIEAVTGAAAVTAPGESG